VGKVMRPLLMQGSGKLGRAIHVWSIPAIGTCPGSTELCRSVCYADRGHFPLENVRERHDWCYRQSRRADFVARMVSEIRRKGVLVLRLHAAGDFYSREYAGKWLEVMRQLPRVRFYFYTRSWRVAEIAPVLEQMAALSCCRVWYSLDRETGVPASVPRRVRLAYLQVEADEEPEVLDLRFVVRKLKGHARRVGLPLLCDHQAGQRDNCGSCGKCFR
jgi:Gene product 88